MNDLLPSRLLLFSLDPRKNDMLTMELVGQGVARVDESIYS